jgi:phosphohistidine swiveling domain-containing protein
VGERRVIGRVRRLTPPFDDSLQFDPDEIVVLPYTDRACVPILRRVAGLVTAQSSQDDQGRLLAIEMGIPAVIGIRESIEVFIDGMQVVLDAKRGVVYERARTVVHGVE